MSNYMIHCVKCKIFPDKSLELTEGDFDIHHIFPRTYGGTDLDGRIYLCKNCHRVVHEIIPTVVWGCLDIDHKKRAKEAIKKFTLKWVEQ